MRLAESVTFGGSGLDRAAHLRGEAADLHKDPAARVLPLWRGKPAMIAGAGGAESGAWCPPDLPALAGAAPLFLGLDDGAPRFAVDLRDWAPEVEAETLGAFADPSEQRHPDLPEGSRFVELRAAMTALSPREAELAATARALLQWHEAHGFCARCGAPSVMAQAGWRRDCPACGTHHFPRTDPVVIMLITRGNDVLLGRSPGWPEGMYSLLAGFVEPGETVEAAVRREVFEESGVRVGAVDYLASQPWPFPASLMLGCRGRAESRDITVDPVEIEEALWLSREDVARAFAGEHPRVRPPRKGAIAGFLLANWLADTLD